MIARPDLTVVVPVVVRPVRERQRAGRHRGRHLLSDVSRRFLETVGRAVGKRVVVFSEDSSDGGYPPLMAYELAVDRVVCLADPWS